jgi:hypothetical protein
MVVKTVKIVLREEFQIVGFVVDNVALEMEYFDFPCQFSFH